MRQLSLVILVFTVLGCGSTGSVVSDPPRSFPIFEAGKFGFINAAGEVTVQPNYEYWGTVPVGGGAAPQTGPEGMSIQGTLRPGMPGSGSLTGARQFWMLADVNGSSNVRADVTSREFDTYAALYEYVDGNWVRRIANDDGGAGWNARISYQGSSSRRGPLGLMVWGYYTNWGSYEAAVTSVRAEPQMDFLATLRFTEGLMPYQVADRWGVLAEDGTIAVNPQFDRAAGFSQGLAAVLVKDRWGFIDRTGKMVIAAQFDRASAFKNNRAPVTAGDRCGYIDRDGRFAVNPMYDACGEFSDGVALVFDEGRVGAVDADGKVLIAPQFDDMTRFAGEFAGVKIGEQWGLADRSGKVVLTPQFDGITPPVEGRLWLVKQGNRFGFIDDEGKYVVGPTLDAAFPFSDGVSRVRRGERWAFVTPDGNPVGSAGAQYDDARDMINGRAAVRMGTRWGFIDGKGEMLVSPTYDAVGDFAGKLAAVIDGGRLGYIDRAGKLVRVPAQ